MKPLTFYFGLASIGSLLVAFLGGVICLYAAYTSSGRQRKLALVCAALFASIPALLFTAQYIYFQVSKQTVAPAPSRK